MRVARTLGLVLVFCLAMAGSARATDFKIGSYDVTLRDTDLGLVLWSSNLLTDETKKAFSLDDVGDSYATSLFRLGTNEGAVNLDDLVPYPIEVALSFEVPAGFGGTASGLTGATWFGSSGYVGWYNPAVFAFGTTGLLGVSLSGGKFSLPGSIDITATFQLLRADTRTVPEAATLALLGMGAAFAAARSRRRRVQ